MLDELWSGVAVVAAPDVEREQSIGHGAYALVVFALPMLGSALLEVAAISRAVGGRRDLVTVVPCDAAARIAHPLCRAEGIPLLGGGGTNLRAGFAKALRSHPKPDVVVVLTDGQTPWPSSRPPCRTVVGLFPRHDARTRYDEDNPDYVPDNPPDWARVVQIG